MFYLFKLVGLLLTPNSHYFSFHIVHVYLIFFWYAYDIAAYMVSVRSLVILSPVVSQGVVSGHDITEEVIWIAS